MAGEIIRPSALPDRPSPVASEKIPVDNGATVAGSTIEAIVLSGRPTASQAEAEAGTDPNKAMVPLTTKQAITAIGSTLFADVATEVPAGGSSGQILAKASASDYDMEWVTSAVASAVSYAPQSLTTPEQLQARNNISARAKGIGEFFWFMGNTAPSYGLVLSGQTGLLRANYPLLWAHIQTSGLLAASDGSRLVSQFGPGDGSTTFSLPNLTGSQRFIRANTGANIGTVQADATDVNGLSATTTATSNAQTMQPNTGGAFDLARGPGSGTVSLSSTDTETRPLNISLLPCIVAL